MSNIPVSEEMVDQTLVDSVMKALDELQKAQSRFIDAINELEIHKSDPNTHADIRREIANIVSGAGFATREEIEELLNIRFENHKVDDNAHPKILDALAVINNTIATMDSRITALEPTGPLPDDMSELERLLAAIDAEYDPIIASIKDAWNAAVMSGNNELAAELAENHASATAEKSAKISEVMKEYSYVE